MPKETLTWILRVLFLRVLLLAKVKQDKGLGSPLVPRASSHRPTERVGCGTAKQQCSRNVIMKLKTKFLIIKEEEELCGLDVIDDLRDNRYTVARGWCG